MDAEVFRPLISKLKVAPHDDECMRQFVCLWKEQGGIRSDLVALFSPHELFQVQERRYPEIMASVEQQYRENFEDAQDFGFIRPDKYLTVALDLQWKPQGNKLYRYPSLEEVRANLDFETLEQVRKLSVFVGGIQNVLFELELPLPLRFLVDWINSHLKSALYHDQNAFPRLHIHEITCYESAVYLFKLAYFPFRFIETGHSGIKRPDGYTIWFKDGRRDLDERIWRQRNAHQQLLWMQENGYAGITPESKSWEIARGVKYGRRLSHYPFEWLLAAYHPSYEYMELAEEIPQEFPMLVGDGVMICEWDEKERLFTLNTCSPSEVRDGLGSRPAVRAFIAA